MNKQYYLEYFELERHNWWFRVRESIIKDILTRFVGCGQPLKILNIGAATGRTSEMLAAFGDVTSIEYDKDCCEFVRAKTGLPVINASILELPFPEQSFDLVCAFDVIEHVEDDSTAVLEMERVCKRAGYVYVTVPAFKVLWSHHDVVNQHFRRYTLTNLSRLFKDLEGSNVFKSYFNSVLFLPIFGFRVLSNLFGNKNRKGSGSDFSVMNGQRWINRFLFKVFSIERPLLKFMRFPAGVSIIFLWKKD